MARLMTDVDRPSFKFQRQGQFSAIPFPPTKQPGSASAGPPIDTQVGIPYISAPRKGFPLICFLYSAHGEIPETIAPLADQGD
jgi:hypothetical protein